MQYATQYSNRFRKQYKKLLRSGNLRALKALNNVIILLIAGNSLSSSYRNHNLVGELQGSSECHILPDWLLIYRIDKEILVLELIATGSHGELFK